MQCASQSACRRRGGLSVSCSDLACKKWTDSGKGAAQNFASPTTLETPTMSQYIDIPAGDGRSFRGYLALPASGSGPGIVLCQEIFGINDYVREVADLYAEEG